MNQNRHITKAITLFLLIWFTRGMVFGQSDNKGSSQNRWGKPSWKYKVASWNWRNQPENQKDKNNVDATTLMVKFNGQATINISTHPSGVVFTGISAIDLLNEKYQCIAVEKVFSGVTPKIDWNKEKSYTIKFRNPIDIESARSEYLGTSFFEHVLLNQPIPLEFDRINRIQLVPNDQNFIDQWGLENDSVTYETNFGFPAKVDADIDMSGAWDCQQGDSVVVVAILDTGCKLDHPEFSGRIWVNHNEIPNDNIDNDNNGYIDDDRGWDFANSDNDPTDVEGHGTSMTSVIGAIGNNDYLLAGVDWNCKLMIVKIADSSGNVLPMQIRDGIRYATDNGADIINFSASFPNIDTAIGNAIYNAYTNEAVFVAAIGNTNANIDLYPAAYDDSVGVLAVGASSANDERTVISSSIGSTYSSNLDVIAPGDNIISLYHLDNINVVVGGGTSEATALVSGLAALLKAQDTTRTTDSIISIIKNTAEDQVGRLTEDTQGFDIYHGNGRINAEMALCLANSIGENKFMKANIDLFPNPTGGNITAFIDKVKARNIAINVYDIQGRLMSSQKEKGKRQVKIRLPYEVGMYLVEIIIDGEYRSSEKIIKTE